MQFQDLESLADAAIMMENKRHNSLKTARGRCSCSRGVAVLLGLAVLHLQGLHLLGHLLMLPVLVLLQGQAILVRHVLVVVLMLGILIGAILLLHVLLEGVSLVQSLGITLEIALLKILPHLAPMRLR